MLKTFRNVSAEFMARFISVVKTQRENKVDTVVQNKTGYINIIESLLKG